MWPRMQLRNPFLNFMSIYQRKHSDMDYIRVIMSGAQHWNTLSGQQRSEFYPDLDAANGAGSGFGTGFCGCGSALVSEFNPDLFAANGSGSGFGSGLCGCGSASASESRLGSASESDDSSVDCLQDKTSSRKCSKRCNSGTDKYKGFLKFIRKFRETHGCLPPQKLVRKAVKAWLKLSKSQKEIYRRKGSGSKRSGGCKRKKRSCLLEVEQKEEDYGSDFMLETN